MRNTIKIVYLDGDDEIHYHLTEGVREEDDLSGLRRYLDRAVYDFMNMMTYKRKPKGE